jgi:poly-gamma-glutamate synthesis protein (capsule biosynthesis protein)
MGANEGMTVFLCGDVMTGRGIDQVLPHSVDPTLYEPLVRDARAYVRLAEQRNGPIPAPVDFGYVWGDALEVLDQIAPDVRLINLETSLTTNDQPWESKEIHYRMHPGNVPCLANAGIGCCVLANNHVLDWGYAGLLETLRTLEAAGIKTAGAGRCLPQAAAPAVLGTGGTARLLVFAFGSPTSGVPWQWGAAHDKPGVNVLPDLSAQTAREVVAMIRSHARDGDLVIVSVHWGPNWGDHIPREQVDFAHWLVDQAGVQVFHGHSSHHVKGLEIYKDRLILYGCGDFVNDYEGIGGQEEFRPDLTLMYLATFEPTNGTLTALRLVPMRIRRFQLKHAARLDALWLRDRLDLMSERFGVRVVLDENGWLTVRWN